MSSLADDLDDRRAIIDRRALSDRLDDIAAEAHDSGARRRAMVALLRDALDAGREEINRRLLAHPSSGRLAASATAFSSSAATRRRSVTGRRAFSAASQSSAGAMSISVIR